MSGNHTDIDPDTDSKTRSDSVNLLGREAHLASLCVAIVFGLVGAGLSLLLFKFIVLSNTTLYLISAVLGFSVPWLVCQYYFTSAHHWYRAKSIAHRIYDLVGLLVAIGIVYLHH